MNGVAAALAGPRGIAASQGLGPVADLALVISSGLAEGCDDPFCRGHTYLGSSSTHTAQLVVVIPDWHTVGDETFAIVVANDGIVVN